MSCFKNIIILKPPAATAIKLFCVLQLKTAVGDRHNN